MADPDAPTDLTAEYQESRSRVARLVATARQASAPWVESPPTRTRRAEVGARFFLMATERAGSILQVAHADPEGSHVRPPADVLSLWTLTRSLLETYLAMYYFGVDPVSDDEWELRYGAWVACGEVIRVKGLHYVNPDHPRMPELAEERDGYLDAWRQSPLFSGLQPYLVKRVESGQDPLLLQRAEVAKRAGFSDSAYRSFYKHASDYTHGGPLAEAQFASYVQDLPGRIHTATHALHDAERILSLMILQFQSVVPRAQWRVEPEDQKRMLVWAKILAEA